jgi:hypothetical protein
MDIGAYTMIRATTRVATAATLALMVFAFSATARAQPQFAYDAVDLGTEINGAPAWRYDYVVSGREFSRGESFEIYFPLTLYHDLNPVTVSDGWSGFVLIAGVPGDFDDSGFAALADQDDTGLERSFSVEFGWLGKGVPGAQRFDLFDADFNVVAAGTTVMTQPTVPESTVPEPSSALLILAAALGALSLRTDWLRRGARR